MAVGRGYPRLFSEPIELDWAGWRSDTATLQQHGWDLAADQDVGQDTMRIAMRHQQLRLTAITELLRGFKYNSDPNSFAGRRQNQIGMHVEALGDVKVQGGMSLRDFPTRYGAIDATPRYVDEWQPTRLEDLVHFVSVEAKRIILPQESVPELMERILKIQQPMREEHFLERAKREKQIVHARLVSFG